MNNYTSVLIEKIKRISSSFIEKEKNNFFQQGKIWKEKNGLISKHSFGHIQFLLLYIF